MTPHEFECEMIMTHEFCLKKATSLFPQHAKTALEYHITCHRGAPDVICSQKQNVAIWMKILSLPPPEVVISTISSPSIDENVTQGTLSRYIVMYISVYVMFLFLTHEPVMTPSGQ